ncbi:MAG TPA: helicase C-terminal domain-containing protein [Nitrospirota bacterium]|nr:helicase C-terminal domain-containing protein [Nitrospirota bacterium]
MNALKFFGKAGLVSQAMATFYEYRPQQIAMSEAVENALATKTHLIVEAGTGVGKSLAYLVPLIHWARQENCRVMVATYTKTLQQQLVEKDLPFLIRVLGDFRFALCVGGENYLCLRRFDHVRMGDLYEQSELEGLNRLFSWSTKTRTGLKSELEFEPSLGLWSKVCRQSDLCFGKDCGFYKDCCYQKAKTFELQAHILVANHHLFFADMATGGNVLPYYKAVAFDEAHQIEDVATDYLGIEVSNSSIRYLLDSLLNHRTRKGMLTRLSIQDSEVQHVRGMIEGLRVIAENFFLSLHPFVQKEPTLRIKKKFIVPDILSDPLLELSDALHNLEVDTQEEELEVKAFASRAQTLASAVTMNLEQRAEDFVYWAEREHTRCRLVASPVDVAEMLREHLFDKIDTVVLTSATLSAAGTFTYIKSRLGIDDPQELLLDSPFDYENQAILYIASGLDEQKAAGFQEKFDEELKAVLSITKGRTLVLFTSYGHLRKSADTLRKELPSLSFLCQGEIPAYRLIEQFKNIPDTVLMGTASFWQGIDIPGDALQCVVIAKLPFAVPDEPIIEARLERLKNPFFEYQVPQATLLFRQGFGRLIRTKTDCGAVAVLDSRILSKNYGKWFLQSIPQCRITDEREDFKFFFERLKKR